MRMAASILLTTLLFAFSNAARVLYNIPDVTFDATATEPGIGGTTNATLIWNDEFDELVINDTKWTYDIPAANYNTKNQQQTYTTSPDNIRISNGNLEITAMNVNGNITSAWVDTRRKFEFFPDVSRGIGSIIIESRIKLPRPGQGFWPAFWLNPSNITRYGPSPGSGEIDILETINDMKLMYPTMHYGGNTPETKGKSWNKIPSPDGTWADDYHVYSMLWEPDTIAMFIDGEEYLRVYSKAVDNENGWYTAYPGAGENAPFDAPFYMIINFAVGGNWPDPTDDTTVFPATMLVDYVRVFATSV